MNNKLLQLKVTERLNKLSSKDYDNIESWKIQEAVNKAQLEVVRRQVYGLNLRKQSSEQSTGLVDDLQILIKSDLLSGKNKSDYFEAPIPEDYLYYIRTDGFAKTSCCESRRLVIYQGEEANVGVLLTSEHTSPSFDWAETFSTLAGNHLRIYTNGEFEVEKALLTYYRKPRPIAIAGSIDPETGSKITVDVPCELKIDLIEIIIDEAAAILAGDIENTFQIQREIQNSQRTN